MNSTMRLTTFASWKELVAYSMYNLVLPAMCFLGGLALLSLIGTQIDLSGDMNIDVSRLTEFQWIMFVVGFLDILLILIFAFWFLGGTFTFVINLFFSIPRFVGWLTSGTSH